MLSAGSTVLTLSLTRPVWVRAYIDEPNLGPDAAGPRAAALYRLVVRISRITAKSALSPPPPNSPRKPLKRRTCVPTWCTVCRIIVTDADDALRQGHACYP